jgi:hypothetical protein
MFSEGCVVLDRLRFIENNALDDRSPDVLEVLVVWFLIAWASSSVLEDRSLGVLEVLVVWFLIAWASSRTMRWTIDRSMSDR